MARPVHSELNLTNSRSRPGSRVAPGSYRLRLDDGYARIDEAALSGTDVSEWESFWISLLREYEDVCRELDKAA